MNGRRIPQVVPVADAPPADTTECRPIVLVVYDANDALETALLTPPELLITDVVLPGMNGIELAITIRRIFPDCKILLCSGQAAAIDLMSSARSQGHHFTLLSKPVHPREMLARVSECLGREPERAPVHAAPMRMAQSS
jgi:DNA-binding response OmpR family regulator